MEYDVDEANNQTGDGWTAVTDGDDARNERFVRHPQEDLN